MKKCECCSERIIHSKSGKLCLNCLGAVLVIQRSVKLLMDLHGVPTASGYCVECRKMAATCRDHRYYSKPLQVENVCGPCNHKRGHAFDLFELVKQHRKILPIDTAVDGLFRLPEQSNAGVAELSLTQATQALEVERIMAALSDCRWNRTRAARMLGINFRALRYRIEKYGLEF